MAHSTSRRTAILPALRIVIWLIIAVALVKFAFFPNSSAGDGPTPDPSVNYEQITTTVQRGSISSDLSLQGTIQTEQATPVKATASGTVSRVYVDSGTAVSQGEPIIQIAKETQADSSGEGTTKKTYENVVAPTSGVVTVDSLLTQQHAVGEQIGSIQPSGHSVVANVTPEQMYRVQQAPTSARITVKNGPAPFDCPDLKITTSPTDSSKQNAGGGTDGSNAGNSGSSGGSNNAPSSIQAKCKVPEDQPVFAGLQAKMDVTVGQAENVLTLPVTAVEGRYQSGYVYVPTDNAGKPRKVQVTLGLTDGVSIEITGGIEENQEVLEFVPSSRSTCDPSSGERC
ncbi:MAG: efflux RND transporter periplasmic adaptor subunit [Actinomycetaceae bacterium]|nr:efflux RND transporter periplasmic adaptor subunit [Actinomycetaceae bacterium]